MRGTLCGGLCLALAALGLVAVGCGGGDDELTKAEFVQQANGICAKGDKQINAEAEKVFSESQRPSNAEIEKFAAETAIPNIQGQVDDIRELDPPSEDEDEINAFLDAAQADLDKSKEDTAFLVSDASFAKANKLGHAYGVNKCAGD